MRREEEFQKARAWYETHHTDVRSYMRVLHEHLRPAAFRSFADVLTLTDIWFPFREVEIDHADADEDEFIAALWLRARRASTASHVPYDRYSDIISIYALAASLLCLDRTSESLLKIFYSWLAYMMNGVVMERRTYERLSEAFGKDSVRYADTCDERNDIDLYLCDVPVSVKNGSAFSVETFTRYRYLYRKTRPLLYIDENLRCAIPTGDAAAPSFDISDVESVMNIMKILK